MGRVTWVLLAVLCALASHIAYVLFVPNQIFERSLTRNVNDFSRNKISLLTSQAQDALFPSYHGDSVTAICPVDVQKNKIVLKAQVPKGYWTLAIHADDGSQVYSINDAQAEADTIEITMSLARGFIEQVLSGGDGEEAGTITNLGWNVELPSRNAVAVIWIPLTDPLTRPEIENLVGKSTCTEVKP